jgi:hypothetical protein
MTKDPISFLPYTSADYDYHVSPDATFPLESHCHAPTFVRQGKSTSCAPRVSSRHPVYDLHRTSSIDGKIRKYK